MSGRIGKRQAEALYGLCFRWLIVVGDQVDRSLVRRGLMHSVAGTDRGFLCPSAAGLRALADEIDAGRVSLPTLDQIKRPRDPDAEAGA